MVKAAYGGHRRAHTIANSSAVHMQCTYCTCTHKETNEVGTNLQWAPSANQMHLLDVAAPKSGQGMLTDVCALQQQWRVE